MNKWIATVAAAALALGSGAALADHGNPWATAEDTVLSKNHDANQLKSAGTPGEAEMRGVLTRNAFGKTGGSASDGKAGSGGGAAGGSGGGKGGGGKGGSGSGGKGGKG
ncbi:hypothetical protein [Antarctobacter jejuensis]|uniref:hypothetical protein n=1 Tax=Antarctobacter jejuensis TaxID=1439938 RepID=UPI003FD15F94